MDEYLKKFSDRINGLEIGVGKTQAPKATLDGFTQDDGTWNSLVKDEPSGKNYRERVETLIFSGNTVYLAFMPDGSYKIPGGGTEPGVSMEESAIKECKEEAFIIPKNLAFVDTYAKDYKEKKGIYDGGITNLFVGEFGSEYTGTVHDEDLDPKIRDNGRFYDIDQVYDRLTPFHRRAVDKWRSTRIATESVVYYEMTAKERNALPDEEFGIPYRRAFPLNDAQHVKSAITMFRHCPEKERAELAKRIFAKYRKFNLDVKISKKNPLWKYAKKETGIVTEGVDFVKEGSERLDNYKQIVMSVESISRFSTVCPKLTDLKFGPEYSGFIWTDESAVVGFVHVTRISGEKWLTALYVEPEYQDKGLEEQMARVAARELGATRSRVNEEGIISKLTMQELGFEPSSPNLPVERSYEDYSPHLENYKESIDTNSIMSLLDNEWEMMVEAPGDDEPTDYTADIEEDPDAEDDDIAGLDDDVAALDDDFDNLDGENDDIDEDPTDYTDDMDSPDDDDDDMEGDSTDYTADMDEDDPEPEAETDDPAEAEAPEEPADAEAQPEDAPAEDDAPADEPDDAEPVQEAPGDAGDDGQDAPAADDAGGGEDAPAEDQPAEGGDEGGGDDAAADDDADMGEPTDYTDDTGEGDDPAAGDEGGDDAGGGEGGGGDDEEMPEEEIEDKRQSLEIYRNLQALYDSIEGYINRLNTITVSTTNSSVVIQGVKSKFDEIRELLNDYMVTKFSNDSLVEQSDTYTKFIVSTKMVIDLLKNNQVYLKQ